MRWLSRRVAPRLCPFALRKDATIQQHGNCKLARDEILALFDKKDARRGNRPIIDSLAETQIYRMHLIGDKLKARS